MLRFEESLRVGHVMSTEERLCRLRERHVCGRARDITDIWGMARRHLLEYRVSGK